MSHTKIRWSKVYESSEEELVDLLRARNLPAQRLTADPSGAVVQQTPEHEFTIWCAEGSLVLRQGAQSTSLQPGDALRVSAHTPYELRAGLTCYVCYVTS